MIHPHLFPSTVNLLNHLLVLHY